MAEQHPLEPIRPEDFGELISGPADRSVLTLQPGLKERLVDESGGSRCPAPAGVHAGEAVEGPAEAGWRRRGHAAR